MRNRGLKYGLFLILFSIFSCIESPVNWEPSFDSTKNIPYGTSILRKELTKIFPDSNVENIRIPTGDYFYDIDYHRNAHYMFFYNMEKHTQETWTEILAYVNHGGTAFVSMPIGNPTFLNNLSISISTLPLNPSEKSVQLSVKKADKEASYIFDKGFGSSYVSNYNPETTDVLGYMTYSGRKEPNFVKVYYGEGYIFIHTEPYAFTNYHMLNKNHYQYVVDMFSYLNDEDILWDNHRIHNRKNPGERDDGGFFNSIAFILKHPSLKWAFFLLLGMGILYLIFNAKRRQKAIPIILPYKNYTLDFAKTLSELYRYNTDHTALVRYKINYFLEQIRVNYNITAKDTEKDFSEILSAKSGVDLQTCEKLVLTIDIFKSKSYLDKEDFFKLQSLIESFNLKSNSYGRSNARK